MKRIRLLICDDDKSSRNIMRLKLDRMENVEADFAVNGAEGLEKFVQNNNYDMIFTKIALPGISGDELIEIIREDFDCEIPIIATFRNVSDVGNNMYSKWDIDDVLAKPFNMAKLQNLIKVNTKNRLRKVA